MPAERIFNIFIYFNKGIAFEYGVRHYRHDGNESEKTTFLANRAGQDFLIARHFRLSRTFTANEWLAVFRLGDVIGYFEEAFKAFRARPSVVFCITSIVDGRPRIEMQIGSEPFRGDVVTAQEGQGAMPDYLVHYTNDNTFRFTKLIDDDYFKAIKMLFNAKLYVSASKLLMSCIDTLSFVEYGDVRGNFTSWLDTFVDLTPVGVTSSELWEFRNSVLHTTSLESRHVIAGKVSPIMPYVGGPKMMPPVKPSTPKPFNLYTLITSISVGISKWGDTYNADPEKILKFIERYDITISDSRMSWFTYTTADD